MPRDKKVAWSPCPSYLVSSSSSLTHALSEILSTLLLFVLLLNILWWFCWFGVANEICEKLAVVGFGTNMITYLTTQLHMPLTQAANTLTNFGGTASLTPLIGAFICDAYAGRFWTIAVASIIYQMVIKTLYLSLLINLTLSLLMMRCSFSGNDFFNTVSNSSTAEAAAVWRWTSVPTGKHWTAHSFICISPPYSSRVGWNPTLCGGIRGGPVWWERPETIVKDLEIF